MKSAIWRFIQNVFMSRKNNAIGFLPELLRPSAPSFVRGKKSKSSKRKRHARKIIKHRRKQGAFGRAGKRAYARKYAR